MNVCEAAEPGATVPLEAGPDGEIVQAGDGGVRETAALPNGAKPGLLSVALTVNVRCASAADGIAGSAGRGAAGGPYTCGE